MASSISHRGPDAEGFWFDSAYNAAFGHRRLSIVDLSPTGSQPMASASGRYITCFNGEIYNFQTIRSELESLGAHFRGHSDTEVLLEAIERWDLETALSRFIGMFAFALWDTQTKTLSLVRDRLGKKPLYFIADDSGWAFASELKALVASGAFPLRVSSEALSLYMRYGYIPSPLSIYEGVKKVEPGTIVTLTQNGTHPTITRYWDVNAAALKGLENPSQSTMEELCDELDDLLADSVRLRMIADVPLGAFLSGGIDSSSIVAMMRKHHTGTINTYTIGFNELAFNEAIYAREVAAHFGTEHHELYVTERDLLKQVTRIAQIVDEPMADISIFPTLAVSELAGTSVKVVLSGDGGDELFCGYSHYQRIQTAENYLNRLPRALTRSLARPLLKINGSGGKLPRAAAIGCARNQEELCRAIISQWQCPSEIVHGGVDADRWLRIPKNSLLHGDIRNYMMLRDMQRYMVDDILHKVDRASMAASIEARAPLLDHRIVEFAWRIPLSKKIQNGTGKLPLRAVLDRYLPRELYDRPKKGFAVPISAWLRGELRDWASALIEAPHCQDYFDQQYFRQLWQQHLSERHDRGAYLWNALLFLQWFSEYSRPGT